VALAAAHALQILNVPAGYEVYYEVLTGERKSADGLVAQQTQTLKDGKKMAELGLEEGLGFVPYADIGFSAAGLGKWRDFVGKPREEIHPGSHLLWYAYLSNSRMRVRSLQRTRFSLGRDFTRDFYRSLLKGILSPYACCCSLSTFV
jgi:hypothetical protein